VWVHRPFQPHFDIKSQGISRKLVWIFGDNIWNGSGEDDFDRIRTDPDCSENIAM